MKLKRTSQDRCGRSGAPAPGGCNAAIDRRGFLRNAGLGMGALTLGSSLVREAQAAEGPAAGGTLEQVKTICGNCAVGCGLVAEVQNGVWVSQEPWYEHPVNQGSLCSKGAAAREHVISEKRLRYPMKLEGGKWKRLGWDQAMGEITARMQDLRAKHGPDALMILGSAHHGNESAYALRKFAAFWGSNNIDHQARI